MEKDFKGAILEKMPPRANPYRLLHITDVRAPLYKTAEEFDRAVANGTFDVRKTMYLHNDGRVYHLCWKESDAPLQDVI